MSSLLCPRTNLEDTNIGKCKMYLALRERKPCHLQLLSSLSECLCVDAQSLGVWRQLYTKHLTQSR